MKRQLHGISIIMILATLLAGTFLAGCDNAALPKDEGAIVSGTVTLPASVSSKTWAVYVDADYTVTNGWTKVAGGTVTGTSFNYAMAGVPAGTYYVYAIVYMGSTVTGNPAVGDYVAMYGAESVESLPDAANCPVPASGTAVYDMDAVLMPEQGGGSGGDEGVTVSGTVSLPTGVTSKPYLVVIDADTDGGNGYEASASGIANGGIIEYSIDDVAVGSYYIYAIVYASETGTGAPAAGDYFGAWSAESISDWPNDTAKASITADGTNDFDFDVYLAPDMGGENGGSEGGILGNWFDIQGDGVDESRTESILVFSDTSGSGTAGTYYLFKRDHETTTPWTLTLIDADEFVPIKSGTWALSGDALTMTPTSHNAIASGLLSGAVTEAELQTLGLSDDIGLKTRAQLETLLDETPYYDFIEEWFTVDTSTVEYGNGTLGDGTAYVTLSVGGDLYKSPLAGAASDETGEGFRAPNAKEDFPAEVQAAWPN